MPRKRRNISDPLTPSSSTQPIASMRLVQVRAGTLNGPIDRYELEHLVHRVDDAGATFFVWVPVPLVVRVEG